MRVPGTEIAGERARKAQKEEKIQRAQTYQGRKGWERCFNNLKLLEDIKCGKVRGDESTEIQTQTVPPIHRRCPVLDVFF